MRRPPACRASSDARAAGVGRTGRSVPAADVVKRLDLALYLLTMLAGIFAQGFVSGRLVVPGAAAATSARILANKGLFELGFTAYMIEMASQTALTALFYELLAPGSRSVSLVAAFIGLGGCVIKIVSRLFYLAPLLALAGAHYLKVFDRQQLQALGLLFLEVNDHGAGMSLAFFGLYAVLTGYLIARSSFLPRILGVWSVVAGLGWLSFLSPTLGYRVFTYAAAFGFLGALALILWLLVFGLKEGEWYEQAGAGAGSARR
jgi:hypothetical protein